MARERTRTLTSGTHELEVPVAELEQLAAQGHEGAVEALKGPARASTAGKATSKRQAPRGGKASAPAQDDDTPEAKPSS